MWFLLALSALFVSANSASPTTVSIYYESLCPYCREFFKDQLVPAYSKIGDKIKLDLVPLSSVREVDGKVTITCQHGPAECYGNRVQACALDLGVGNSGIEFALCAMGSSSPSNTGTLKQCAINHEINWDQINNCLHSGKANDLLVGYYNRTISVSPPIQFTPTIALDNHYVESLTYIAQKNFQETVEFIQSGSACYWCKSKMCN